MDFAKITRKRTAIELDEWNRLIESHDFLEPIPDREATNPFTNTDIAVSGAGKAFYIQGGSKTGNIVLEDGQLLATGVPISVCTILADEIAAEVFEDDRS